MERRARTLAQAVCGSVGSQSTATNVPALRVGTDRPWRPQERSADGEAACARGMRSIASLHCGRGLGRNACGNRTPCPSRQAGRRQRCRAGVDDTAIPKKGTHSVGVAPQYASALGKTPNCQTLVSLTLSRGEVPVVLALRLFLPESWTSKRSPRRSSATWAAHCCASSPRR